MRLPYLYIYTTNTVQNTIYDLTFHGQYLVNLKGGDKFPLPLMAWPRPKYKNILILWGKPSIFSFFEWFFGPFLRSTSLDNRCLLLITFFFFLKKKVCAYPSSEPAFSAI